MIRQRRGAANRLGFAAALLLMTPWHLFKRGDEPVSPLLRMLAAQLKMPVESWDEYASANRHGGSTWSSCKRLWVQALHHEPLSAAVHTLTELAFADRQSCIVPRAHFVENLRRQSIILPAMNAIERASAEAITRAN